MNRSIQTMSSALVLALALTTPAWAQLRGGIGGGARGDSNLGLGRSSASTSTTDRAGLNTSDNLAKTKGSAPISDKTSARVNAKKKTKMKTNAMANASANGKVKKQKGHHKNSKDVQVNSDATARLHTSEPGTVGDNTGAAMNSDAPVKAGVYTDANVAVHAQDQTALH
jgi:hypothetical protein